MSGPFRQPYPYSDFVWRIFNMKFMKGRSRFVTSLLARTSPSYHAARATAWESYTSLHLGKQVSHMEPASASQDALDLL